MEVLSTAPEESSFVPLAEHQSRTPSSFHTGPPVLYYHSQRCKVVILERDLVATHALNALRGEAALANGANGASSGEAQDEDEKEVAIEAVDTWVTSDKFLLYSPATSAGISIPYPSICLHAIQRLRVPGTDTEVQGLYMQIATPTAPSADEDEEQCITLTVVPPHEPGSVGGSSATVEATTATVAERATQDLSDAPEETPTQLLYDAVSACSNLHPDPVEPGDEEYEDDEVEGEADGEDKVPRHRTLEEQGEALYRLGREALDSRNDLPPPVAGSSGWITADNMHEFFDEEGNWIAGGEPPSLPLGPGAGTVRAREENGQTEENGEGEDDETKWRRTD
ncbi:hypothetical protein NUU61_001781 [Penicillium alfredii]|uniref:Regulator of volume decrease after cellular swelling-domain-containing protein n=1 Tax=Penicillium alfredii TaxID=1506179 RepID=A0A9W9FQH9_9EURO|nr:uncharacterized protein NUU61_001781 [Penicillium alfredii]KAJ5104434.1 hypothetical protein NUU61_001781 [Penicillium alfredii]